MAGFHFYSRRICRIFNSKALKLSSICIVLFLGVQWVILHNFEADVASPVAPRPTARLNDKGIDWSRLYHVQYVTTPQDLCSVLMIWSEIETVGGRARRLMFYPSNWNLEEKDGEEYTPVARMLQQAKSIYHVKIRPLDALVQNTADGNLWAEPYTKLLGFNLTEFDRVLIIDSASIVKQNMDDLFLIPAAPLAMPYVYWGEESGWHFSAQLALITPSAVSFSRISEALRGVADTEYDTSILETLFFGQIIKIPQRPFALLSGEYRRKSHTTYLGLRWPKKWDPDYMLKEAKVLHFADHPLPKPWLKASQELLNRHMPKCEMSEWFGSSDCRSRALWLTLYGKYADSRNSICGSDFAVVPGIASAPADTGRGRARIFHPE